MGRSKVLGEPNTERERERVSIYTQKPTDLIQRQSNSKKNLLEKDAEIRKSGFFFLPVFQFTSLFLPALFVLHVIFETLGVGMLPFFQLPRRRLLEIEPPIEKDALEGMVYLAVEEASRCAPHDGRAPDLLWGRALESSN